MLADGRLSERLRALPPGTPLAMADRAKGGLHVDTRFSNQLLIATVTGIAPYVSFLRDHLHRMGSRGGVRFVLLHGASHAAELGYAEELTELARRHRDTVVYVPTVSRPESPRNAGWTGIRGRVETHIEPLMTRLGLHAGNTAVFACGHPDMVSNVSRGFRRRGFAIQTEPFD